MCMGPTYVSCNPAIQDSGRLTVVEYVKIYKRVLMGTSNREHEECSRNILEYKDSCKYIPMIFLLYSWGSLFGVPIRTLLPEFIA